MAAKENGTMMNKMMGCREHLKQQIFRSVEKLKREISCTGKEFCLRAAGLLAGIFAFVWWCVFYPELCFPQDTYEAVYEGDADNAGTAEENCRRLLQADKEQVIVKSRLLEWLEQHIE